MWPGRVNRPVTEVRGLLVKSMTAAYGWSASHHGACMDVEVDARRRLVVPAAREAHFEVEHDALVAAPTDECHQRARAGAGE